MLAPILGTNPSTPASPARYGLWLDGLDVIREPAVSGLRRWGTLAESIDLRIAGPGGVSSVSFVIDDPAGNVSVGDGMTVRLHDHVSGIAMFYGWVDHFETTLLGVGRAITVAAIGAEALLDWYNLDYDVVLPVGVFVSGGAAGGGIQALVAACGGVGELRALTGAGVSTQAQPIAELTNIVFPNPVTITAGTTLREAIAQLLGATAQPMPDLTPLASQQALVTVDPTLGLRVFEDNTDYSRPGDGTPVTISTAGPRRPTHHEYGVDATGVIRAVRVIGAGGVAAVVADGTGKRGRTTVLRDTTLTTVDACRLAGAAYLADYRAVQRGSITDENAATAWDPGLVIASPITITDAQLGASGTYRISGATWRLYGAKRDVTFEYGAQRGSAASMLRRLTRDTLN